MTRRDPFRKLRSLKLTIAFFATLLMAAAISATSLATPALAAESSATMWTGVDFAWHGTLDPQAFKKAGVDFVVRYLAGGKGSSKEITHYEADMWSKAGVGIVLVWETTASRARQGYDAGYKDASLAFAQAKTMGMPDGKPVYFAVDFDATGQQVEPYFKGIYDWARTHFADGQATSRIGVYGGHDVVKYIEEHGYAKYKWQALAWMHGKGWQADAMQQHAVERSIGGVNVDLNRVWGSDYGVWFSTCVVNPPKRSNDKSSETDRGGASEAPGKEAEQRDKAGDAGKADEAGRGKKDLLPRQALEHASTTISPSQPGASLSDGLTLLANAGTGNGVGGPGAAEEQNLGIGATL